MQWLIITGVNKILNTEKKARQLTLIKQDTDIKVYEQHKMDDYHWFV
jgi:hypothetical protein